MKRKTQLVCLFVAAMLLLCSIPVAAASGGGRNDEDREGFLAWADSLRLADPGASTKPANPSQPNPAASIPTEDELKAYADRVFELVNQERENAGVAPLERNESLDEAANIRANDCASVNSLYVNGQAHIRPDGSRWFSVLGIDKNYNYGENVGQGGATADVRMKSFMNSEGHKANILREDYTEIGIGCAVSEQGVIFTVQIFYRP